MTLTFELDLDMVKLNHYQIFRSKVILFQSYCPDTHRLARPTKLLCNYGRKTSFLCLQADVVGKGQNDIQ